VITPKCTFAFLDMQLSTGSRLTPKNVSTRVGGETHVNETGTRIRYCDVIHAPRAQDGEMSCCSTRHKRGVVCQRGDTLPP
jgi:hypothetical protein